MKIFNKSEWKKVKLGDICEVITGNTPSKKIKEYWDKDEIPFITPPELKYEGINYITPSIFVSKIGAKQGRIISKNSICVCCIGSLGKLGILKDDAITNQQINSLILKDKNIDFKSSGIPLIRIGNINSGQFKSTNLVFIEENKKFEKFKVFPNDILISLTGTVGKDDYGNACILGDSYSEYYLNQRNAKIELTDKINKNFFLEIMKIKEVKKKLTGISRGIRQANISNRDIYNLSFPLPPIELQNKFAERVEKIEKLSFEIEKSIKEAENLYNSLISKYFD